MKSISSSTPIFPSPDVNSTGKSLSSRIASCSAGTRSSSGIVPFSNYFSISSSLPSATSSTSFSCASFAHLVGERLHAHEVDNAAQILLASDGKLQGRHRAAEGLRERLQRAGRV